EPELRELLWPAMYTELPLLKSLCPRSARAPAALRAAIGQMRVAGTSPATGLCPGSWRGLARRAFGPPDLAGDRPGIADCLDKMHAVTDPQLVEIALHQTVAVEIELRPFMRQHKAVIFVRLTPRDSPRAGRSAQPHLAALLA